MYEFGKRLKMIRREKGVSLEEVALNTGTTKSTLSKYEREIQDPSLDIAYRLANYFLVSIDWLVGYGDTAEIIHHIPSDYVDVIKMASSKKISPAKLSKIIEAMSE